MKVIDSRDDLLLHSAQQKAMSTLQEPAIPASLRGKLRKEGSEELCSQRFAFPASCGNGITSYMALE